MIHDRELLTASAALGDRLTVEARLRQIERALQFDEDPERRKQLRREFLDLTDKRTMA